MTPASMVTAYQGGQIDALVQFDVLTGAPLFTDANFTVVDTPTTNHRQIWMHTDTGRSPTSGSARRLALTIDRPALIQQLFKGKGVPANDHVIWQLLSVLQRHRHAAGTGHREGQAAPRRTPASRTCQRDPPVRRLERDPGPCRPPPEPWRPRRVSRSRRPARTTARSTIRSGATRPSRPTRRAPATPSSASSTTATGRARTSSSTRPTRRTASGTRRTIRTRRSTRPSRNSRARSASMPRRPPARRSRQISNEDTPIAIPYFYNYLSGNSKKFTGVYTCALGQMFVSAASTA